MPAALRLKRTTTFYAPVNQLVNARLNRGEQMRWSARGAHRVLQVRAAVLDGRLHAQTLPVAA